MQYQKKVLNCCLVDNELIYMANDNSILAKCSRFVFNLEVEVDSVDSMFSDVFILVGAHLVKHIDWRAYSIKCVYGAIEVMFRSLELEFKSFCTSMQDLISNNYKNWQSWLW